MPLEIFMSSKEDVGRAMRQFTAEIARREGDRYAGAFLFGSRARNEAHADSDVDIAVILRGKAGNFVQTKLALADVAYDVLLDTGVYIQPLPLWEEEWRAPERHRNPRLVENIRREGVPL
jgi:antitoxin ChpS